MVRQVKRPSLRIVITTALAFPMGLIIDLSSANLTQILLTFGGWLAFLVIFDPGLQPSLNWSQISP